MKYLYSLLLLACLQGQAIQAQESNAERESNPCHCSQTRTFGQHWSICKQLFDYILETLPEGSTMIELGSGWASGQLSQYYDVWSVEHDKRWIGQYDTNYIYAPLVNKWYSVSHLQEQLPKEYDLLLVDGPPGVIGRGKFFDNIYLFNTDIPIIFDDVNRKTEYDLMMKVAHYLNREVAIMSCGNKKFGVLLLNQ